MNILIVLNQAFEFNQDTGHDYVIGVDGGCRYCLDNELTMNLAIGDFDSLATELLETLKRRAIPIEHHAPEKDATDCELAIRHAMGLQPDSITVTGVLGGRADHSLANLLCLATQTGSVPVTMPGQIYNGYLLKSRQSIELEDESRGTVSIMALTQICHGVSNRGLKYPLQAATLPFGVGWGLSNEIIESRARITLEQGVLLVLADTGIKADIEINEEE